MGTNHSKDTISDGINTISIVAGNLVLSKPGALVDGVSLSNLNTVYNVKDYGAKGNSSDDDYAVINTALSAIKTAGGGILYFPDGHYLISATLDMNGASYSNIHVKGNGNSSFLDFTTYGVNGITSMGTYGSIEDVQIKTNAGTGIYVVYPYVKVRNIYFSGGATGFNGGANEGHDIIENVVTANLTAQTLDFAGTYNIVRNWKNITATSTYGVYLRGNNNILENFEDVVSTVSAIGLSGYWNQIINPRIDGATYAIANQGGLYNHLIGYRNSLAKLESPAQFSYINGYGTFNKLGDSANAVSSITFESGTINGGVNPLSLNASLEFKRTDTSLQEAINTANAIRTAMISHFANATRHTTGQQSTASMPAAATNLTNLEYLIGIELSLYLLHNLDAVAPSGWAYHNAQATAEALVDATAPTTLAECVSRLTDLVTNFDAHEVLTTGHDGVASVPTDQVSPTLLYTYSTISSDCLVGITNTAVNVSVILSTADMLVGRMLIFKDESGGATTHNITISTQGSEKIDGADYITISVDYGCARIYSNGVGWFTF